MSFFVGANSRGGVDEAVLQVGLVVIGYWLVIYVLSNSIIYTNLLFLSLFIFVPIFMQINSSGMDVELGEV